MINDKQYMAEALIEAKKALAAGEVPVGCVIVKDNEIISRGHNTKEQTNQVIGHAEINAISSASSVLNNWRLRGCTIYVTLEPCPMCASAIVQSRMSRVVFGTRDNKEGAVVSSLHVFENNHNHQLLVTADVLAKEADELLNEFMKTKRVE